MEQNLCRKTEMDAALPSNAYERVAAQARASSLGMQAIPHSLRSRSLEAMAAALRAHQDRILAENARDLAEAEAALPPSLVKRLRLDAAKIEQMAAGLESVQSLPDPVGCIQEKLELAPGLILTRVSCPLGVIAIIFESRPDVVPQIMGLCVQSCNSVIFKGGTEAKHSNRVLYDILYQAGVESGLPENFAQLADSREAVAALLQYDQYIDLVIPRGGNALVRSIMDISRIPVLGHADGICSMYIHAEADPRLALALVHDAKVQYPAVCNAIENLLIDRSAVKDMLPPIIADLANSGVRLLGDSELVALFPGLEPASEEDWECEYNDLILSIAVVGGIDEAIRFINAHGSGHTDAIVTANEETAGEFALRVDSSSVMINASTRFSDGFRYGKGAEIGISTNKIHARGPVGMEGLIIYKYIVQGAGHCVADFTDAKAFTHRRLI
jgi:glutamate-5-semialdehyde dehydrogenase